MSITKERTSTKQFPSPCLDSTSTWTKLGNKTLLYCTIRFEYQQS